MDKIKFSKELNGDRIVLKEHPMTFEHAKDVYRIVEKDREGLKKFLTWAQKDKTGSAEDYYNGFLIKLKGNLDAGKKAEYMITLNDKFIGQIGFMGVDYDDECGEIGYWLDSDYQGNGYILEAVKILEKHIFDLGFYRILIRHAEHNEGSKKVIINSGYEYEGTSRKQYKAEDGRYDLLHYSKLNS